MLISDLVINFYCSTSPENVATSAITKKSTHIFKSLGQIIHFSWILSLLVLREDSPACQGYHTFMPIRKRICSFRQILLLILCSLRSETYLNTGTKQGNLPISYLRNSDKSIAASGEGKVTDFPHNITEVLPITNGFPWSTYAYFCIHIYIFNIHNRRTVYAIKCFLGFLRDQIWVFQEQCNGLQSWVALRICKDKNSLSRPLTTELQLRFWKRKLAIAKRTIKIHTATSYSYRKH